MAEEISLKHFARIERNDAVIAIARTLPGIKNVSYLSAGRYAMVFERDVPLQMEILQRHSSASVEYHLEQASISTNLSALLELVLDFSPLLTDKDKPRLKQDASGSTLQLPAISLPATADTIFSYLSHAVKVAQLLGNMLTPSQPVEWQKSKLSQICVEIEPINLIPIDVELREELQLKLFSHGPFVLSTPSFEIAELLVSDLAKMNNGLGATKAMKLKHTFLLRRFTDIMGFLADILDALKETPIFNTLLAIDMDVLTNDAGLFGSNLNNPTQDNPVLRAVIDACLHLHPKPLAILVGSPKSCEKLTASDSFDLPIVYAPPPSKEAVMTHAIERYLPRIYQKEAFAPIKQLLLDEADNSICSVQFIDQTVREIAFFLENWTGYSTDESMFDQVMEKIRKSVRRNLLSAKTAGRKGYTGEHRSRSGCIRLTQEQVRALQQLEAFLSEKVKGQDEMVKELASAMRQYILFGDLSRPLGLLIAGATGVGKGLALKTLADFMSQYFNVLGDDNHQYLYTEATQFSDHEVEKWTLRGTPPGLVGFGNTPLLKTLRPYSIWELAEIERSGASTWLWEFIMELLTEGFWRAGDGTANALPLGVIIALTTNLGTDKQPLGFHPPNSQEQVNSKCLTAIRQFFPPAFLGRISKIIMAAPIAPETFRTIAKIELSKYSARITETYNTQFSFGDGLLDFIVAESDCQRYGARNFATTVGRVFSEQVILDGICGAITADGEREIFIDHADGEFKIESR